MELFPVVHHCHTLCILILICIFSTFRTAVLVAGLDFRVVSSHRHSRTSLTSSSTTNWRLPSTSSFISWIVIFSTATNLSLSAGWTKTGNILQDGDLVCGFLHLSHVPGMFQHNPLAFLLHFGRSPCAEDPVFPSMDWCIFTVRGSVR